MPDEDFGAGIDTAHDTGIAIAAANQPATTSTDSFMSEFRSLVDGVPEDFTRDQVADHLVSLTQKATRTEELERQNLEFQAQLALVARKGTTAAQEAASGSVTEPDEFELPWKPVKVDPQYRAMVKLDDESGGFLPKNSASPVHIAAAEEMNRRAQYERQFSESLFDDPESAVTTLTRREFAKLRKEYDDKLAAFEQKFKPIEQANEQAAADNEFQRFLSDNSTKLFMEDGSKMTALGSHVDVLLKSGKFTPAEALSLAESMSPPTPAAAIPAAATAKTATVPTFSKPARLVDDIQGRIKKAGQVPPDRKAYDGGSGRWKKSWQDIDEQVTAQYGS